MLELLRKALGFLKRGEEEPADRTLAERLGVPNRPNFNDQSRRPSADDPGFAHERSMARHPPERLIITEAHIHDAEKEVRKIFNTIIGILNKSLDPNDTRKFCLLPPSRSLDLCDGFPQIDVKIGYLTKEETKAGFWFGSDEGHGKTYCSEYDIRLSDVDRKCYPVRVPVEPYVSDKVMFYICTVYWEDATENEALRKQVRPLPDCYGSSDQYVKPVLDMVYRGLFIKFNIAEVTGGVLDHWEKLKKAVDEKRRAKPPARPSMTMAP